ncbi:MAG: 2-oxoglutarate dehydrogenase E1 component [Gammaproteobacteria bacterium]|jgi:2-oxoglutarate dehydrogenase E1 component
MSSSLDILRSTAALSGSNANFIEEIYEQYLQDPTSVSDDWRKHFDQLPKYEELVSPEVPHSGIQQYFASLAKNISHSSSSSYQTLNTEAAEKQAAVLRLINAYRVRGHQHANLDPLCLRDRVDVPDLSPAFHNLSVSDMDKSFNTGSLYAAEQMTLRQIIDFLEEVYCSEVGSEYMHITDTEQKRWIQKRLEGYRISPEIDDEFRRWLMTLITAAEGLERYLHTKYVGQKRFSLEGGESLIPLLDELIQRCGDKGIEEVVIGMAHRGRLNVLTNILGKPPQEIFDEFEGNKALSENVLAGDVKYHMGFSTDIHTPGKNVHVALGFNPSHLEIIGPVVQGSVRARQHRRGDHAGDVVLPIIIHGDSAFAGQGVVMESFNMSQARGYTTGGAVHIVINNQIGFTTSNPLDTRSTMYCTDVGKTVQAPIFHVNGDDPEAVIFVTRLALDFRNRFRKDVIIDLVCYRRHGHNEADEPAVTQPMMYKKIRNQPTTRELYAQKLIAQGIITPEENNAMVDDYRNALEKGTVVARPVICDLTQYHLVDWSHYHDAAWEQEVDTNLTHEKILEYSQSLQKIPEGFELHPRLAKIVENRHKMAIGELMIDWGYAEILAYASLVDSGIPVRLSGQDSGRGTFFHRHAVYHNQQNGDSYVPLQHINDDQADFVVIDSVLSEEAVLAYEYGYATAEPAALTIWEAQFGDFANGAQVVIDQFISSAHSKWGLHCGLTLFLPHGYEGQGAEHSSARIERYMQLSADHNQQVCVPSSAAQIFHLLRRQMIRPFRRPLIVMSPKSLLRHPLAASPLYKFTDGKFHTVIPDPEEPDPIKVTDIIMCSGKLYYELHESRKARALEHCAIIRIEQLYPFPVEDFSAAIADYSNADKMIWCQEEPQNQGAWDMIKHRFMRQMEVGRDLFYVGRPVSAAPAVGYPKLHKEQQEKLIEEALTGQIDPTMNTRMPQ